MELGLGTFAVVVEEAYDSAVPLGHEKLGTLVARRASDAVAESVERVALLDDRVHHGRVADQVLVRFGHRYFADCCDGRRVRRARVPYNNVESRSLGHELGLRIRSKRDILLVGATSTPRRSICQEPSANSRRRRTPFWGCWRSGPGRRTSLRARCVAISTISGLARKATSMPSRSDWSTAALPTPAPSTSGSEGGLSTRSRGRVAGPWNPGSRSRPRSHGSSPKHWSSSCSPRTARRRTCSTTLIGFWLSSRRSRTLCAGSFASTSTARSPSPSVFTSTS